MENEYYEKWKEASGEKCDWIDMDIEAMRKQVELRPKLIMEYSFAVPSQFILNQLAAHAPLIELGAGSGYWTHLLQKQGVDIIAYDVNETSKEDDRDIPMWGWKKTWAYIHPGDQKVLSYNTDRTLFICWPTYQSYFAEKALQEYDGDTFLYIGESEGGCCANDAFFRRLHKDWSSAAGAISIPRWWGIRDSLWIYKRRK